MGKTQGATSAAWMKSLASCLGEPVGSRPLAANALTCPSPKPDPRKNRLFFDLKAASEGVSKGGSTITKYGPVLAERQGAPRVRARPGTSALTPAPRGTDRPLSPARLHACPERIAKT
jgi:hypothetical protein